MNSGRTRLGLVALLCLVALLMLPTQALMGQERFGILKGVATDASGAVLPNVAVTIMNKALNKATPAKTGSDGSFIVRQLEPGRYSLKFELTGFSVYEVPDVSLLLGQTLEVNANMQVGTSQQTVQVTEESPLIDVSGVAVSHSVTSEEFDRLPKARSFQSIALASPSVNSGDIEGGFQVNGASGAENQFTIDGISTNSAIDGRSRQDSVFEFLQEVQVKTGGIEAEYGGAMGGVISAVTKSGGNAFHGDIHYYFQGNQIAAAPVQRLLLSPADEKTVSYVQDKKDVNNRNEVGYTLGGYLVKDKLFFFSSASPRWVRRSRDYLMSSGTETDTLKQSQLLMQAFNKLSFDPTKRIRSNFAWMYTPSYSTGSLISYNYGANTTTSSKVANQPNKLIGYNAPQWNLVGNVDLVLTNTTLLSVRGGRFWDNFKTTGIPAISNVTYQASATALPFDIPASLRQPVGYYNTPRVQNTFHDLATRTFVQLDASHFGHFLGQHDIKGGWGVSKSVNNVNVGYPGGGYVYVYWDKSYTSLVPGVGAGRGTYGYYEVDDIGTRGSTGGTIQNLYIQDRWRVTSRLSLDIGLRTENEKIPSFRRDIRDVAFQFNFQDKIAPRLGGAYDVFGDGKLKIYASWGRFFDWVKYELSRGTFGGDFWTVKYRALDTTDVFSLSGTNTPGKNLWSSVPGSVRDRRVPSFDAIDPAIKPMSTDMTNVGVEYQLNALTVVSAHYVHNNLRRTIEDLGALVDGNEVYYYANPGEGAATSTPTSGATKPFPTPKPVRTYDAMELTFSRRYANRWFGSASYVLSRLYGNYAGLGSSDEISTPTTGVSSGTTQQQGGSIARPGSSATRSWDIDEILWDSHGKLNVLGRLATDRPHVVKLYGSYFFPFGTEAGVFFYGGSGTPLSTYVNTVNQIPVFVNGRGDLGRTPIKTQTDLVVAHEIKFGEKKKLRLEFNALNLFNQKTALHSFNSLNRGAGVARPSSAINLTTVDLAKGYDYNALILKSSEGANAYDPRFGKADLFNAGFTGRFGAKFTF